MVKIKESGSYQSLCKESSYILNSTNCSISLFSITWLHIIRDHPIYKKNYSDYFKNKNLVLVLFKSIAEFIQNLLLSIFQFIKKILIFKISFQSIYKKPADIIFLSHIVDSKNLYDSQDFYFGKVPIELTNNLKVEILYFNWTNEEHFLMEDDQIQRTILDQRFNFLEEIRILAMALFGIINLLYILFRKEITFRFFLYTLPHVFSIQTLNNLRRYLQFSKIFINKKPSKVICTFEGHAHEKLFFIAAKKTNHKIQTYAYQHSAIFKNQFSVLNHYLTECIPDHILTSGNFPMKILKSAYPDSKIRVVGSHKCGEDKNYKKKIDQINFLFVPEGFESETIKMLSFAKNCAQLFKNVNFIFRLHPLVADNPIVKQKLEFISDKNLILSCNSMNDDLDLCQFVIYRGSTAVLDAAMAKLIPIYLDDPSDSCELDALYMLDKIIVSSPDDLKDLVSLNKNDFSELLGENTYLFEFIKSLRERISSRDFDLNNV